MKAVNLVPSDARRGGVSPTLGRLGPAHAVIGALVVLFAYVTIYVLTSNTIAERTTRLAGLKQQISQVQTEVTRLNTYAQFEKLAQQRATTVRQIASSRFDWHRALSDLSRVVPANTSFQSLTATAANGSGGPGASTGGGGGSSLRGAINAPAFELKGCTASQDAVAQLMSRLRLMTGVTRVTLEDSTTGSSTGTGAASATASSTTSGECGAHAPSFDMVVFFQPVASGSSTAVTP